MDLPPARTHHTARYSVLSMSSSRIPMAKTSGKAPASRGGPNVALGRARRCALEEHPVGTGPYGSHVRTTHLYHAPIAKGTYSMIISTRPMQLVHDSRSFYHAHCPCTYLTHSALFCTHILGPTCAQHAYIMHQCGRGLALGLVTRLY